MHRVRGAVLEDSIVILVVEDDQGIQQFAEDALSEGGFKVEVASSGGRAIELLDLR